MQLSGLIIDDRHQARFKVHRSAFNIYPGHAHICWCRPARA